MVVTMSQVVKVKQYTEEGQHPCSQRSLGHTQEGRQALLDTHRVLAPESVNIDNFFAWSSTGQKSFD